MSVSLLNFDYRSVAVAIFCIMLIFFFPSVCGPYSVVHGPVTALRSICARLKMLLVLAIAFVMAGQFQVSRLFACPPASCVSFLALHPPNQFSVLRC